MQSSTAARNRSDAFTDELLDLSRKLTQVSPSDFDQDIQEAIHRMGRFLQMDYAFVVKLNALEPSLLPAYEWCRPGLLPLQEKMTRTPLNELPYILECLKRNESLLFPSVHSNMPMDWKLEHALFERNDIRSVFLFPVMNQDQLVGVIGFDSITGVIELTEVERSLLNVWGSMLSAYVRNKNADVLIEQNKQNFEVFFNTVDDFLWVLDLKGNILHCNRTVKERLDFEASDLLGKSILEVHPEEFREEATRIVVEMLEGSREVCPLPLCTKSGVRIPVETRIKFGKWNGLDVLFGVSIDVTELKRQEEAIRLAKDEAEFANRAKSEFLSRMSHELRTPLNSIIGFAQLLEMSELSDSQQKSVSHIHKSGNFLLDLINEVLDITRIEAGKLALNLEHLSVNPLLLELADALGSAAESRKVTFHTHEFEDGLQICTDALRLKQVLLNLMNNAIKYNREGGDVYLKTKTIKLCDSGKPGVRISVRDTGKGIPEEKLQHLFQPFERAGAEYSGTEGTGLGLAVVKKLVALLGGDVCVQSEVGIGSTFWIDLPLRCPGNEIRPLEYTLEQTAQVDGCFGNIIYVEDNRSNIDVFAMMMKKLRPGIRLHVLESGKALMDQVERIRPDLIILDLNLPDISGEDLCDTLKANGRTREIPIVVLSADAMESRVEALMKKQVKHYLTKPFVIANMLSVIDEFVRPI
jgi:PAS domain S-box-containing protein